MAFDQTKERLKNPKASTPATGGATANPYQQLTGGVQAHADAPASPLSPYTQLAAPGAQSHADAGGTPTTQIVGPGVGAQMPPQSSGEALGPDSGPSATGYVNFDRLYNANAGTSAREATARAKVGESKAAAAKNGLAGAQNSFNAGLTGARNAGPSSDDYSYLTGGRQFETDGGPTQPGGEARAKTEGEWRSGLEAGAKAGYSGPNALSAMDEYAKLAQDTAAAQDAIENPLTGLNSTDAALLGAAGRPRFEADKARFGGLKSDLLKANDASAAKAKAQHESDLAAQSQYERLLSDYEARKAAENKDRKTADAKGKSEADRIAAEMAAKAKFVNYVHGGSEADHWQNSAHDVADMLSPSAWIANAAGEQGIRERVENTINPMGAENTSNVWHGWKEDDADVYNSMSQSDWATFAGMNDGDKRRWIEKRKAELRGGK